MKIPSHRQTSTLATLVLLLVIWLGGSGHLAAQLGPMSARLGIPSEVDSSMRILGFDYVLRSDSKSLNHAAVRTLKSSGGHDSLVRRENVPPYYCGRRKLHAAELNARLDLGDDYQFGSASFSTSVQVTLTGVDSVGGTLFTWPFKLESATGRPEQQFHIRFRGADLARFDSVFRIYVAVTGYDSNATVKSSLRLTVSYNEEIAVDARRIDSAERPFLAVVPLTGTRTDTTMKFQWSVLTACSDSFPNYQLQLLRLYNVDTSATYKSDRKVKAVVDWRQALTVETGKPARELALTMAQGTGFYVWRVRPIGSYYDGGIANDSNWGAWTTSPPDDSVLSFTSTTGLPSYALFYQQFNDSLNWIYQRAFTEGTRQAEGMTYLSPLLLPKQSQVRIASRDSILVGQTVYDNIGRGALMSLPAPRGPGKFGYVKNLLTSGGRLYSAANFDSTGKYASPDALSGGIVDAYYSSSNLDSTMPSAEHYPFFQTRFLQDGTGRTREVGGVGAAHRIGSAKTGRDRTQKMYYGGVSSTELIRMFGDEAPADTSVWKIVTVDANKVASISYMSSSGQLLATCVGMHQGDQLLVPLAEDSLSATIVDRLTGNRRVGTYDLSSTKRLAFADTTSITLRYAITPDTLMEQGCIPSCSTCDYGVQIYIRSVEKPDSMKKYTLSIGGTSSLSGPGACSTSRRDTSVTVTLAPGTYTFERRLLGGTIDPASISDSTPLGISYPRKYRNDVAAVMRTSIAGADSLSTVLDFLSRGSLDSLYLYLGVDPDVDSVKLVGTGGCCPISVPIITPDCGLDPCRDTVPDFELYLTNKWGAAYGLGTPSLLEHYFWDNGPDSTEPTYPVGDPDFPFGIGAFNAMIDSMMDESGAGAYSCKDLWTTWKSLVDNFGNLAYPGGTKNADFSLLDNFLNAVGKHYAGVSTTRYGSTGYLSKAYKYFKYSIGSNTDCETQVGYNVGWNADSSSRWAELQRCVVARSKSTDEPGEGTLAGGDFAQCLRDAEGDPGERDICFLNMGAAIKHECEVECDTKFSQVVGEILKAYDGNISGDSLGCLAAKLIDSCKNLCKLSVIPNGAHVGSIGTTDEWNNFHRVYSMRMVVSTPSPSCPDSATQAPGNQWPYHDRVVEYLNNSLRSYARDSVGIEGDYWNINNAMRRMFPRLVGRIADSVVYVRYRDTTARFARESGCELWYHADTMIVGTPANPHPLVGGLNSVLNGLWGYRYQISLAPDCSPPDPDPFIVRAKSFESLPASYTDIPVAFLATNYWFVNGSLAPHPASNYFRVYYGTVIDSDQVVSGLQRDPWDPYRLTGAIQVAGGGDSTYALLTNACSSPHRTTYYRHDIHKGATHFQFDTVSVAEENDPWGTLINPSLAAPYSQVIGRYEEDSQGYLVYRYIRNGASIATRIHGLRFYARLDKQISTDICDTIYCPAVCFAWAPKLDTAKPTDTTRFIPCTETAAARITAAINQQIGACIESKLAGLEEHYISRCSNPAINDSLTLEYPIRQYHYTLYYYDRAGHLVRTVPPKGVDLSATSRSTHPSHTLVSRYEYNSLGQLVWSRTPDGDTTFVYYDSKGRPRFSQNQLQRNGGYYAYVRYDSLGRVVQTGRSSDSVASGKFYSTYADNQSFPYTGTDKVTTVYTTPGSISYHTDGSPQQNLRNRVSYVTTDDATTTYYSYDAHGNVEWVAQAIPGFPRVNFTKYTYDLISGNVTRLDYNEERTDQFHHRYSYDEDNRLTSVETSRDGVIWDGDARYRYQPHGPLKRRELGEDKLQGLDYTYTIRGQLKAVNHPLLGSANDPGHDGSANSYPADSFAIALGYYKGDFSHPGSKLDSNQSPFGSLTGLTPLYDGNVSWTMSNIGHVTGGKYEQLTAEIYGHDQLGRIDTSSMKYWASNKWIPTTEYSTGYDYDGNGNIQKLNRRAYGADTANRMDSLSYSYVSGRNRLDHVSDAIAGRPYTSDLATQSSGNYGYDAIGQMTSDAAEGLTSITWDTYGKVKSITKNTVSGTVPITLLYDGGGNRVRKRVTNPTTGAVTTQFYVYDAGGNVMAIYQQPCADIIGGVGGPDTDHDGIPNGLDNCPSVYNPDQRNADGDAFGDACDTDDDNDSIPDVGDIFPYKVGAGDPADWDGDGVPNALDRCPKVWSPDNADTDHDGFGDACDPDIDGDGLNNEDDNCPTTPNPSQTDSDGDGIGDACDCAPHVMEYPIYGIAREGLMRPDTNIFLAFSDTITTRLLGLRAYELTDHLGNVRATISDLKLPTGTPGSGPYKAEFLSYMHPYPFGMPQPGRFWESKKYRYGFNGMERDDEVKGSGESYAAEFRMFDPRVGRWLSIDPVVQPWESPYAGIANNPVLLIDPMGADTVEYSSPNEPLSITIRGDRMSYFEHAWSDFKEDVGSAASALGDMLSGPASKVGEFGLGALNWAGDGIEFSIRLITDPNALPKAGNDVTKSAVNAIALAGLVLQAQNDISARVQLGATALHTIEGVASMNAYDWGYAAPGIALGLASGGEALSFLRVSRLSLVGRSALVEGVANGLELGAVANAIPDNAIFARIMPKEFAEKFVSGTGSIARDEAWITAADDIAGLATIEQVQQRLSLFSDVGGTVPRLDNDAVVLFKLKDVSSVGFRSPFETANNPRGYGFKVGGRTGGGAREWLINAGRIEDIGAYDVKMFILSK